MDIQTKKLQLIEWLVAVQDQSVIEDLLLWKEKHEHISLEQYNKELDDANKRIEAGEFTSHEDVVKESASWLK